MFLTGLWIEAYPAVTRELSANPLFELGNHSYSHGGFRSPCYGLPAVKKSNEAAEVQKTDDLLKKYAASYKRYFRFPGLCFDADDVKRVEAQDYTVVDGDVDGGDGFEKERKADCRQCRGAMCVRAASSSSTCTAARTRPETAIALPDIIKKLRADRSAGMA